MPQAVAKVKITSKDFNAKFSSKREVYNFVTIDLGAYIPSYGKYLLQPSLTLLLLLQIQLQYIL